MPTRVAAAPQPLVVLHTVKYLCVEKMSKSQNSTRSCMHAEALISDDQTHLEQIQKSQEGLSKVTSFICLSGAGYLNNSSPE